MILFLNYLEIFVDSIVLCCYTYLKNIFDFFQSIGAYTRKEHQKCGYFHEVLISKILELLLSTASKNNVACYSN